MSDERIKVNAAVNQLRKMGYQYNDAAQDIISVCDLWYTNQETEFHQRRNLNGIEIVLDSLNFAKRCCADDANLCEVLEINAGENEEMFQGVIDILNENRFQTMYRKQLERLSAAGTVGAYLRLEGADILDNGKVRGGKIRINYINAAGIVPLTVVNDEITECAFIGRDLKAGKGVQTLVLFKLNENGLYTARTYQYNDDGTMIGSDPQEIQLGDVKPFAIMRIAEVNNLADMEGYGFPKLYTSIPVLKALDLCWNILFGDLDKGEKLLFLNELLAEVKTDKAGRPQMTRQQKELFVLLGEKLPDQKTLIQEYNPEIRATQIREALELCLSLLSLSFGYGTKKYTFENNQIQTATEYIGERQDEMQELNKQRHEARQYITDLVHAVMWFSNTFQGTSWPVDEEISIEFDDSFIIDKETQMASMRQDALSFPDVPEFLIQYIMARLNCERDEAVGYIQTPAPEIDEVED